MKRRVAGTGPAGEEPVISTIYLRQHAAKIVGNTAGTTRTRSAGRHRAPSLVREYAEGMWWGFCNPGQAVREAWFDWRRSQGPRPPVVEPAPPTASTPGSARARVLDAARRAHDSVCACDPRYVMSCPVMAWAILALGHRFR